jgi:mannose-6-phosphate isomerase-like protein (cupin superfamily)
VEPSDTISCVVRVAAANEEWGGVARVNAGALHTTRGEPGRSWWGPGDMYTFLVTGEESGDLMFALDCLVGAGGGPPPHRHLAEDELFTITEGSITFTAGDETRQVSSGESVFVPRGTRHAYRNEQATPARMIAVYAPAGMEGWFREVCTPVVDPSAPPPPVTDELIERMLEAGPRYNIEWVD